eukprot:jgi/Bigna1/84207/fgenesh1_pg.126_\
MTDSYRGQKQKNDEDSDALVAPEEEDENVKDDVFISSSLPTQAIGKRRTTRKQRSGRSSSSQRQRWPPEWQDGEMGSKKALRTRTRNGIKFKRMTMTTTGMMDEKDGTDKHKSDNNNNKNKNNYDDVLLDYEEMWAVDQEAWLLNAKQVLRVGGKMVIIIGDSDASWIDTLESTKDAAALVGLELTAAATRNHLIIALYNKRDKIISSYRKGTRTEHAILLENLDPEFPSEAEVKRMRELHKEKRRLRSLAERNKNIQKGGLRSWLSGGGV